MKQTLFFLLFLLSAVKGYSAISGNANPNYGTSQTYSIPVMPGATSYIWSLPSGWSGSSTTNSITVVVGSCTGTISVYATNGCAYTSPIQSLSITASSPVNAAGSITGNTNMCPGTTQTYSVAPISGAVSYIWTLPPGWSGSSTTNSITLTVGGSSGQIIVKGKGTCNNEGVEKDLSVTVPSPPPAGDIGNYEFQGPGTMYTILTIHGYDPQYSYQWYKTSLTFVDTILPGETGAQYTTYCGSYFTVVVTGTCGLTNFSFGNAFNSLSGFPVCP